MLPPAGAKGNVFFSSSHRERQQRHIASDDGKAEAGNGAIWLSGQVTAGFTTCYKEREKRLI